MNALKNIIDKLEDCRPAYSAQNHKEDEAIAKENISVKVVLLYNAKNEMGII
jgi:hypothetical protein